MKRIKMTLLVAFTMMTGASAGQTEQFRWDAALYMADSLKLDSMYNYWNNYTRKTRWRGATCMRFTTPTRTGS